jgi:DNA-binding NarL/FixJ family response regulator
MNLRLTFRERCVALGLCCGLSRRQIADALGISRTVVGIHSRAVYRKAGIADRLEFALFRNAAVSEKVFQCGHYVGR